MTGTDHDPWRADRYRITRTRSVLATASKRDLRDALVLVLDHAEQLIDAAERQTRWEWHFQRAQGAAQLIEVAAAYLDRPRS
jgi:hypothetical protein